MAKIVYCPECEIRVLTKANGTCPGCRCDLSHVDPDQLEAWSEDVGKARELAAYWSRPPVYEMAARREKSEEAFLKPSIFERMDTPEESTDPIESSTYSNLFLRILRILGRSRK